MRPLLCSFVTNTFNYSQGQIKFGDRKSDAYNAVAAGGILLCICNYALIIFVGLGASAGTPQSQGYAPTPLSGQGFGLSTFGLGMGMGSSAPQPAPLPTQPQSAEKYQVGGRLRHRLCTIRPACAVC